MSSYCVRGYIVYNKKYDWNNHSRNKANHKSGFYFYGHTWRQSQTVNPYIFL